MDDCQSFHRACLLFDGHTDVPTRLFEKPADLSQRLADGHVDLARLREGGVDGLVWALYLPAFLEPQAGLDFARRLHELARAQLRPGDLEEVRSPAELRAAVARGAIGVVWGLENGRPLQIPGALDELCGSRGVRIVTLCHVGTHEWCDSSTDAPQHGGLSPAGEAIVRQLNDRGVIVDVSHVSDDAVRHVLATSRAPVVASHSSAHALCQVPRNLTDELVRAIADADGLVMANAFPAFLSPAAAAANVERMAALEPSFAALRAEIADPLARSVAEWALVAATPQPPVSRAVYVDHLVHLIAVAGEAHVGIGTDFDGIPEAPAGLGDCAAMSSLTADLLDRGLDRGAVELVLGGNFLRVWERVEALAR
jgi:membrane dipeptidase